MSDIYLDIQRAFEKKLNAISSKPSIAWPNVKFEPVLPNVYWRPTVVPSSEEISNFRRSIEHTGTFEVGVYTPAVKGLKVMYDLMQKVYNAFKDVNYIIEDTHRIRLYNIQRSEIIREDAWMLGIVMISYLCIDD